MNKPKVIASYKRSRDTEPVPIYGRRGYGKNVEWMYIYDKQGSLFKFKERDNCIGIDIRAHYRGIGKKCTVMLYFEPNGNDAKQILEMILKGRGYGLYSVKESSRKDIANRLVKEAVVRRLTK